MDWELVGITALLVYTGLIVVAISVLGLTRAEKLLAGGAVVAMILSVAVMMIATSHVVDLPDAHDISDVDAWMARWNTLVFVARCFWWVSVSTGTLLLSVATLHAWRERSKLLRPLKSLHQARPQAKRAGNKQ